MKAYREVRARAVPNAQVALKAADLACAILGLEGLRVRFFLPACDRHARGDAALASLGRLMGDWEGHALANDTDIAGVTYGREPGTIWIRGDLDLEGTIEVVLHEARHVADYRDKGPAETVRDRTQREEDATRFAHEWCGKLEERRRSRA